jgi:hypothetical protein
MVSLTKSEINQIDDAINRVGFFPPWDSPVEKLPLFLLLALSEKVSQLDKRLIDLDNKAVKLDGVVCRLEQALLELNVNNGGVKL